MYKIFFSLVLSATLLISCNDAGEKSDSTVKKQKKISSRNLAINAGNSYSDFFLDSMTVENFIVEKKIPDSMAYRIRSFYNARNFQFAWFSSDGLTEQARGFWNLHNNYTSSTEDTILDNKALQKRMDRYVEDDSLLPSSKDKNIISTEILLTGNFIKHTLLAYEPDYVKRKEMERFVPYLKQDALKLADSLLNKKHKDDKYYEDVNPSYGALKQKLKLYTDIYTKGGWPTIPASKKPYKEGSNDTMVVLLKKRLHLTGEMPDPKDTTAAFNTNLTVAVKKFQRLNGLDTTGTVGESTLKALNVPVTKRIQQILINMDRTRWLPVEPKGELILVNIPEFVLHVKENNKDVFDMDVVVGKGGHDTRIFTGNLNQVVFSPYWNVPKSIVEKEILPAMEKNPGYLEAENMEITGDEDGLPEIRQKPGEKNALGQVKFLFPNSFNIYFHDTPSKSLFAKTKRAFSHGCIRLSDPKKMAAYLLRNQPEWTDEKIDEAMNAGKEKFVKLKKPVPVLITYYTAWVDNNGDLHFRDDIYEHDAHLTKKMFIAGR